MIFRYSESDAESGYTERTVIMGRKH